MSDPMRQSYPRRTSVQNPGHNERDSTNHTAYTKPHPPPQPSMSMNEAIDMVGDLISMLQVKNNNANNTGIHPPSFEDYPPVAKPSETWYERDVVFKGVLPKNFVPPSNNTYFTAFGPSNYYASRANSNSNSAYAENLGPLPVSIELSNAAAMDRLQNDLSRPALVDRVVNDLASVSTSTLRTSPRKNKGVHSHRNDLSSYSASSSSSSSPSRASPSSKRQRAKPESISAALSGNRGKQRKVTPSMDVVASQASRDFEYTEDHALRVKDFAHTINMSSIGRDLDIDELQAPDLLLLYPSGSEWRYPQLSQIQWDYMWNGLIRIGLHLRRKASEDFRKRLEEPIKLNSDVEKHNPHSCVIAGCLHRSKDRAERYRHAFAHVVKSWFCPQCRALFSNKDALDQHLTKKKGALTEAEARAQLATQKCRKLARKYHYHDHKYIFCLFFLGALETYGIPGELFDFLAWRRNGVVYVDENASRSHNNRFDEKAAGRSATYKRAAEFPISEDLQGFADVDYVDDSAAE